MVHFGVLQAHVKEDEEQEEFFIGSDESLKGDTFGGLVVAAVLVNEQQKQVLKELGIQDSKKIDNDRIQRYAQQILQHVTAYSVHSIFPEEYNKFSLTGLLNRHHQETAQETIQKAQLKDVKITHIVDKFPGADVGDILETKAESKYIEVAAASILARQAALEQIKELSSSIGFQLPLGSTHVQDALNRSIQEGHELSKYLKLHFKNVQKSLEDKAYK